MTTKECEALQACCREFDDLTMQIKHLERLFQYLVDHKEYPNKASLRFDYDGFACSFALIPEVFVAIPRAVQDKIDRLYQQREALSPFVADKQEEE
jgi:hypothetical protein